MAVKPIKCGNVHREISPLPCYCTVSSQDVLELLPCGPLVHSNRQQHVTVQQEGSCTHWYGTFTNEGRVQITCMVQTSEMMQVLCDEP